MIQGKSRKRQTTGFGPLRHECA